MEVKNSTDISLDDDKPGSNGTAFQSATLQIDSRQDENIEQSIHNVDSSPNINRNRPYSASTMSRASNASRASRTSMKANVRRGKHLSDPFFAKRPRAFETAVEACQQEVRNELDGTLKGAWLLTEIDHWDNEKEKVVLICDHSLLIFKYDFISLKLGDFQRIFLKNLSTIKAGDFVYPEKSVMPMRNHGGVRIWWGSVAGMTFGQKWNPFSDMPFTTFAHHPLIYVDDAEVVTYNVDDFTETLLQQTNVTLRTLNRQPLTIEDQRLEIESYANVLSMLFNQSQMGFCKERGGVSF